MPDYVTEAADLCDSIETADNGALIVFDEVGGASPSRTQTALALALLLEDTEGNDA